MSSYCALVDVQRAAFPSSLFYAPPSAKTVFLDGRCSSVFERATDRYRSKLLALLPPFPFLPQSSAPPSGGSTGGFNTQRRRVLVRAPTTFIEGQGHGPPLPLFCPEGTSPPGLFGTISLLPRRAFSAGRYSCILIAEDPSRSRAFRVP